MEKADIISGIEELLEQETVKGLSKELNVLIKEFNSILEVEENKLKQRKLAKEEEVAELSKEDKENLVIKKELDGKVESLISEFKARQTTEKQLAEEELKNNLELKIKLVENLEQLNAEEERIGPAIGTFRSIQEEWKSIGKIPSNKNNDIQNRYSKAIEQFNYNIGIYKELKSNDVKKNHTKKEGLILELKELLGQGKIKEVEKSLRIIQQRWDEAGPVDKEAWETLKTAYWGTVKEVQNKIQGFYDQRKSDFNENLKLKIELIEKVQLVMAEYVATSHKEWEAVTKEMLQLQEEWNKVGMTKRENNEQANNLFRSHFDTFFADKQEFYSGMKAANEKLKEGKVALIEKAKVLVTSTDWKQTTEALISIQKQWKNIGTVSRGEEQKLWKTFRATCDKFFEAKQAHFNEMDVANADNLKLKQKVIAKITAFSIDADVKKSIEQLKGLSIEFNAIGHVPFKEKESIYNAYKKGLESHYNQLKLDDTEKETLLFENKIEILKQSADPARAFEKEKTYIRNKISTLKDEIVQSENNLGFFSGKGAEKLKEQVAQNVNKVEEEIGRLKIKLRLIPEN